MTTRRALSLLAVLVLMVLGCEPLFFLEDDGLTPLPPEVIEALEQHDSGIVNGSITTGWDPVVLLWLGGGLCTGTLVSPDVVLTASHCIDGVYGTIDVYWCNNINQGYFHHRDSNNYIEHPNYNPSTMNADIAVVMLSSNGPGTPIPINRDSPSSTWLGNQHPLTFVGFGVTSGWSEDSGVKREVQIAIDGWDNNGLYHEDPTYNTCFGDSGGPSLTDHSGSWHVSSVVSYGDQYCTEYGYNTRVDTYESWIDGYTGGWMPGDDDDDDDDDDVSDDDDDVSDDDDDVSDDDGSDDDTEPPEPIEELPDPRTNSSYDLSGGCNCIGDIASTPSAPAGLLALLVGGLFLAFRRR